ncbi:unnamed protein product, partial [marine sediment metagenome]
MVQWSVAAVYLQEFDVSGKEIEPTGLCFKPDGTKMYIIGTDGVAVDEYNLGTQWNVTTAVWLQEFSVAVEEGTPTGLCFKTDGTKMYVVGQDNDTVYEYDLTTQWDVSTAVYLQEKLVTAQETLLTDVCFKPDGTKMYIIGTAGDAVDEFDLGTQWDVTTAVWLQQFSVAAKEVRPQGLYFKPDGTKMYTVGDDGRSVDEYDLGTQWD